MEIWNNDVNPTESGWYVVLMEYEEMTPFVAYWNGNEWSDGKGWIFNLICAFKLSKFNTEDEARNWINNFQ